MKLSMINLLNVEIRSAADIVTARQKGRVMAIELGFGGSDLTLIATAISEVARNIVNHSARGKVSLFEARQGSKHGICVIAQDEGARPVSTHRATQNGFSNHNGTGPDLNGSKWPMDNFEIHSKAGEGTTVTMKKWLD